MNMKFFHPAALVLTVIMIVLFGLKTVSGCMTSGKMGCHCEERGMLCLCSVFSCPQCASHDDFQEEKDWTTDIFFQFFNMATLSQSFKITPEKFSKPRTVFLEVPENPPRILLPANLSYPVYI
jgi:hypothetical protein